MFECLLRYYLPFPKPLEDVALVSSRSPLLEIGPSSSSIVHSVWLWCCWTACTSPPSPFQDYPCDWSGSLCRCRFVGPQQLWRSDPGSVGPRSLRLRRAKEIRGWSDSRSRSITQARSLSNWATFISKCGSRARPQRSLVIVTIAKFELVPGSNVFDVVLEAKSAVQLGQFSGQGWIDSCSQWVSGFAGSSANSFASAAVSTLKFNVMF